MSPRTTAKATAARQALRRQQAGLETPRLRLRRQKIFCNDRGKFAPAHGKNQRCCVFGQRISCGPTPRFSRPLSEAKRRQVGRLEPLVGREIHAHGSRPRLLLLRTKNDQKPEATKRKPPATPTTVMIRAAMLSARTCKADAVKPRATPTAATTMQMNPGNIRRLCSFGSKRCIAVCFIAPNA